MNKSSLRIREVRRQKDISGTEVAEKLGISAQYYYNIERGKRNLSAEIAVELSKLFGVSSDYLLGLTDDPLPNVVKEEKAPYYALNEKDERDIAKDLERMLASLESNEALAFNGEPMDEETKRLFAISLENSMRLAKEMSKKKFTPNKYRK